MQSTLRILETPPRSIPSLWNQLQNLQNSSKRRKEPSVALFIHPSTCPSIQPPFHHYKLFWCSLGTTLYRSLPVMFSIQWQNPAIDLWSQWEPICCSGEEFSTLFLFWQYVKSPTPPLQPGSLSTYWGTPWSAASNPTGIGGKTPTGFHRLWMKPWSGTPFPAVLWVKSYCGEGEENVDSWRTDSLLWCLGTHYGHDITSRAFTPSTLGPDIRWLCTATSHLPWSKQVRRNKPKKQNIRVLGSLRLGRTPPGRNGNDPPLLWEYRSSVGLAMFTTCPRPCSYGSHHISSSTTNGDRRRHFACGQTIPWCHPGGLYVQMPAQTPQVQCDLAFPIRRGGKKEREEEIRKHPRMSSVSLGTTSPLSFSSEWCYWTGRQPTSTRH